MRLCGCYTFKGEGDAGTHLGYLYFVNCRASNSGRGGDGDRDPTDFPHSLSLKAPTDNSQAPSYKCHFSPPPSQRAKAEVHPKGRSPTHTQQREHQLRYNAHTPRRTRTNGFHPPVFPTPPCCLPLTQPPYPLSLAMASTSSTQSLGKTRGPSHR